MTDILTLIKIFLTCLLRHRRTFFFLLVSLFCFGNNKLPMLSFLSLSVSILSKIFFFLHHRNGFVSAAEDLLRAVFLPFIGQSIIDDWKKVCFFNIVGGKKLSSEEFLG